MAEGPLNYTPKLAGPHRRIPRPTGRWTTFAVILLFLILGLAWWAARSWTGDPPYSAIPEVEGQKARMLHK